MTEKISIEILTEIDKAIKNVQLLAKKSNESLTSIEKSTSTARIAFANFAANIASAGIEKALNVFASSFNNFIGILSEGVRQSIQQEEAVNQLNFALASSPNITTAASKSLQEFANGLQGITTFSDDAILSQIGLLASLTKLDEQGLKRATKAALDFSAATGKDLNEATMMIAKAAEGEVAAFKRLGIEIKKGANDTETFANTLRELERFQGAAENKTKTFSGALAQLNNIYSDALEKLGDTITKNQTVIKIIQILSNTLKGFGDFFEANKESISSFFNMIFVEVEGILKAFPKFMGELLKFSSGIFTLLDSIKLYATGVKLFLEKPLEGIKALTGAYAESSASIEEFRKRNGILGESFIELEKKVATNNTAMEKFKAEIDSTVEKIIKANEGQAASTSVLVESIKKSHEDLAAYKLTKAQEEELAANAALKKDLENYYNYHLMKLGISEESTGARLQKEVELGEVLLANTDKNSKEYIKIKSDLAKKEDQLNKLRLQASSQFFGDLSSLMRTKNREMFEIGKVAAIAQAIIDGYLAVQKALAAFPPPFNFAAAAAVGVRTAVQIAGIEGTNMQKGGIIPSGFPNDTFRANLTSGERVINVEQNKDLTNFLKEQKNLSNKENLMVLEEIKTLLGELLFESRNKQNQFIVNIGNREIFNEIRSGLRAGYSFDAI